MGARNTQLCNTGQDSGLELASPRADPAGPQAGPPPAEDTSKPGGDRDPQKVKRSPPHLLSVA